MPTPRKKYLAKFIDIVYHVVMNNINYAWAAGFMDGEGTITLKRTKSRFTVNRIHYQPFVSIGQANHVGHYNAIRKMQLLFGGSVSRYQGSTPRLETLQWTIVSRQAVECLKKIRPFLVIKDRHDDLLISYYKDAGKKAKGYRLTDDELSKREKIWSELRSINQKGKLHLQRLSEITPNER